MVAIENPGYPPLRAALAAAGASIVPVPVDGEGMVVRKLPTDAHVICVTPSHQFPLGTAMSMCRAALLEFAQARSAVVIEDDYDGEFRFCGRPLDALQSLDRTESVFYIGTFSKSLFPGILLVSWLRRPGRNVPWRRPNSAPTCIVRYSSKTPSQRSFRKDTWHATCVECGQSMALALTCC